MKNKLPKMTLSDFQFDLKIVIFGKLIKDFDREFASKTRL